MKRPRFDSLFARLMLAQAVLFVLLGFVFFVWLTTARADAAATPYAVIWAPDLARAAASPLDAELAPSASGLPLQRRASLPHWTLSPRLYGGPVAKRLTVELAALGVQTDEVRYQWNADPSLIWFHVLPPQGAAVWLAVPMPSILPSLSVYTASLSLLTMGLFTLVSWRFARRVTRPLEQLRSRMVGDDPGLADTATSSPAPPSAAFGDFGLFGLFSILRDPGHRRRLPPTHAKAAAR